MMVNEKLKRFELYVYKYSSPVIENEYLIFLETTLNEAQKYATHQFIKIDTFKPVVILSAIEDLKEIPNLFLATNSQ